MSEAFATALDAVGVAIAWFGTKHGEALIIAIDLIVTALESMVAVISDIVDTVSALMRGDWAGAWDSAGAAVDTFVSGALDILSVLLPGVKEPLTAAYQTAKASLGDGFSALAHSFAGTVDWMVGVVKAIFPGIGSAARSVFQDVKTWLVDKFGWVAEKVAGWASWVADSFRDLKASLGLEGSAKPMLLDVVGRSLSAWDRLNDKPAKPKAPPLGDNSALPGANDNEKGGKTRGGKTPAELAAEREELRLQAQLEAAREREDFATAQRIQDQLDLRRQISAYENAGLAAAEARKAAEADMAIILAARSERSAREIVDMQRGIDIEIARLSNDQARVDKLERQADLAERIRRFERDLVDIADARLRKEEATRLAMEAQARIDAARAEQRAQWLREDIMRRDLELARMRGDTDEEIRRRERLLWIEQRIRELRTDQTMSEPEARAKAMAEAVEAEQARLQGTFRDTFKSGIRAALDGDFKGWFKNWWRDQMVKAMENALNQVSDLFFRLFSNVGSGGGGGGLGGILKGIGGAFAGLFGSGRAQGGGGAAFSMKSVSWLPAFADGGSLTLPGMSGIDKNLLSLNGSPIARVSRGETMHIAPANDRGRASGVHMPINLYAPGADAAALGRLQNSVDRLRMEMPAIAVAAISDAEARRLMGRG